MYTGHLPRRGSEGRGASPALLIKICRTACPRKQLLLPYSTRKSAQCYVTARMGGEFGRMNTYIRMEELLCCVPETITTLLIGYTPIK